MKIRKLLRWILITTVLYVLLYFLFIVNLDKPTHIIIYLYLVILPPIVSACLIQTPLKAKMYLKRLYLYLFSGFVVVAVSYIIIFYLNISDDDSIRYALSALIQSEAAIIALVVTLTLVAVQHTASSYSSRIIDVFKNHNPDLKILLVIYISSIICGLFTLIKVNDTNLDAIKPYVYLTFSYGIFALLALIPYMMFTLNLLKPSKMIEILADDINYENLISSKQRQLTDMSNELFKGNKKTHVFHCEINEEELKNPIQPIFDILIKSLRNYDHPTVRVGISKIVDKISCMYQISPDTSHNSASLQSFIIDDLLNKYFNPLIRISIKDDDESIVSFIIRHLGAIGFLTIDNEDFYSTNKVISYLEKVGKKIIAKKYDNSLFDLLVVLNDLQKKLPTDESEKVKQVIEGINDAAKSGELTYVVESIPTVEEIRERIYHKNKIVK